MVIGGILDKENKTMGYTFGRQLTVEALSEISKKYKSRVEFKHKDSSAYANATRKGVLNKICEHMLPLAFSIPQLISRQIFDQILGMESTYNDRKAIRPLELDIYYEQKKFAVEYCGRGWHYLPDVIERDAKKDFMCELPLPLKGRGFLVHRTKLART
jgi:hypothetical protein